MPKRKTDPKTSKLAQRVYDEYRAAKEIRGDLVERWKACEAHFRCEPGSSGTQIIDDMPVYHMPLTRPKCVRVINSVHSSLTSVSPMALAQDVDPDTGKILAKQYDYFFSSGNGKRVLRQVLQPTTVNGIGFILCSFTNPEGWQFQCISPNDFYVTPDTGTTIKDALFVGHRFYITEAEYKRGVELGQYYDAGDLAYKDAGEEDSPRNSSFDLQGTNTSVETGEQGSRTHEVLQAFWYGDFKADKEVKACLGDDYDPEGGPFWLRVVIDLYSQNLLACEKWPYSRPPYVDVRFEDEPSKFWPSTSVANNLQGLQNQYTQLSNLAQVGAFVAAFPNVLVSGLAQKEKLKIAGIGQVLTVQGTPEVTTIPVLFDGQFIPILLEMIEEKAEAVAGIPAPATGETVKANETATATSYSQAMQMQSESAYASHVAYALEEVWSYMHEVCQMHPQRITEVYGVRLEKGFVDALQSQPMFEMMGKVATKTPQMQMQMLMELYTMGASNPGLGVNLSAVARRVAEEMPLEGTEQLFYDEDELAANGGIAGLPGMAQGNPDGLAAVAGGVPE